MPEVWIFGYGSLVWRPAFAFAARAPAWVEGWERRFWQGSTDHRGLPGRPGRVVTLLESPLARCTGMAYRLPSASQSEILDALDHRERGGYVRESVRLHVEGRAGPMHDAILYRATADNPNYLGPASLEEIAAQVRSAAGPSGSNVEYVLRLAESLRALEAEDDHVFALEALLRTPR